LIRHLGFKIGHFALRTAHFAANALADHAPNWLAQIGRALVFDIRGLEGVRLHAPLLDELAF
jgi:hypothetical protein